MSFYSYKNANASCCPGMIAGDATKGLQAVSYTHLTLPTKA